MTKDLQHNVICLTVCFTAAEILRFELEQQVNQILCFRLISKILCTNINAVNMR